MSQAKENSNRKRKDIQISESLIHLNISESDKSFKKNYTKSEKYHNLYLRFSSIQSALISGKRKSFPKINPYNIKDYFNDKNSKVNGHIKDNDQKIKINISTKKLEKKKVNKNEKEIKVDNKELKSSKRNKLCLTQDCPSFITIKYM